MLNDLFSYFYNNFFRHPKPFCAKVRQRPASLQQIRAAALQIPVEPPHDIAHFNPPRNDSPPRLPWHLYLSYNVGPVSLSKTNAAADMFSPSDDKRSTQGEP
jgi:hypothetical protein